MKRPSLLDLFLRQAIMACAWAIAVSCLAEILIPRSVLAHVSFFWLLIPLLIGSLVLRPPSSDQTYGARIHILLVLIILFSYGWMQLHDGGMSALLLLGGTVLTAILFLLNDESP